MSRPFAVFDIDGTLVDSREIILRAAREACAELGLPDPAYDAVRQVIGLSLHEALRELAPSLTDVELGEFVVRYQESFRRMHDVPGFVEPLYPGAAETVSRLKRDGWSLGVATGKSRRGVERILGMHGWADQFDTAWCADDGPGKPHPSMLLNAMNAVGAGPDDTVMIGDTSHDMRMALAAGTRAQGVSWGFHTREEVVAAGAHHVADRFSELDAELDRFAA
jgi:phosphoglycolate phosphatase